MKCKLVFVHAGSWEFAENKFHHHMHWNTVSCCWYDDTCNSRFSEYYSLRNKIANNPNENRYFWLLQISIHQLLYIAPIKCWLLLEIYHLFEFNRKTRIMKRTSLLPTGPKFNLWRWVDSTPADTTHRPITLNDLWF